MVLSVLVGEEKMWWEVLSTAQMLRILEGRASTTKVTYVTRQRVANEKLEQ